MGKKKITIYLTSFLIFIFVLCTQHGISYATDTENIYLSSNKDIVEINEEIEIALNIKNTKTVSFTSYLYFDDTKLEYVSGPENTNLVDNHVIFVWYDETGGSGAKDGEFAKFKFKAKENGVANFTIAGEFYNEAMEAVQPDFTGVQVQIGKNEAVLLNESITEPGVTTNQTNTNLETLAIENTLLYPAFDNSVTKYNAEVSNSTTNLNILAIPENESAKAEIVWDNNLKEGNNLITINVTAADGVTKKVFEINVYKRNQDEEVSYEQEQEENQKKLEEIYVTTSNEQLSEEPEVEKKSNGLMIVLAIVIGVFVISIGFLVFKRFIKKK